MRNLLFAFIILATVCIAAPSALAFSGSGSGTTTDPFKITTCGQLEEASNALSSHYVITQDIDCTGVTFTPIGASTAFTGSLDGQNHTITNLTISTTTYAGLIAKAGTNASISNLRLESGSVTSSSATGDVGSVIAFVTSGSTNVQVSHVSSKLSVTGSSGGGLIGGAYGSFRMEKCWYNGTVTIDDYYTGGLVGWVLGGSEDISDSYAIGTLSTTDSNYVGGLVGYDGNIASSITRSYAAMTMTVSGSSYVGGLGGYARGHIRDSFAASTISGSSTRKGALFGHATNAHDVYFDSTLAPYDCADIGSSVSCSAINNQPGYFKNTSSNAPLSAWNFTTVWYTASGSYPQLYGYTVFAPSNAGSGSRSSLIGSTTDTPSCSAAKPIGTPHLFQVDVDDTSAYLHFTPVDGSADKYVISYGTTSDSQEYGVEWSQSKPDGAITFPIHMLAPNTQYFFRVRAGNGCMPGEWSNERSTPAS